jgi:cytohesin
LVTTAVQTDAIALLRRYHERGSDIFTCATKDGGSEPSITCAAIEGYVDVIRLLHKLGDNLNAADEEGHPPAYFAAAEGEVEAIRILCELRADINTPNKDGWTPVYVAAGQGHVGAIPTLCELGADEYPCA